MAEGWVNSGKAVADPDAPGYKTVSYRDGDYFLADRYCSAASSSKSAGMTTVWFHGVPVWMMTYGGFYEKAAIGCLKAALLSTYGSNRFVGGRGPSEFVAGSLRYENKPRLDAFEKFEGREEITDIATGALLGFHEYRGMSLV